MNPRIYNHLIVFMLSVSVLHGQELVKKTKNHENIKETYFVLKDNKSIKQGEYLATFSYIMDNNYILEYGNYDNNKKVGRWIDFYFRDACNSMKSMGYYKDGMKDGLWNYYYSISGSRTLTTNLLGMEKNTSISWPKGKSKHFQIEIDTTGLRVMASGQYSEDQKYGIWEYYSQNGDLIQKYDHSSKKMIQNFIQENGNNFLIYLGGNERFNQYFFNAFREMKDAPKITKTSAVLFNVNEKGGYDYVQNYGDELLIGYVAALLQKIPNEWVCIKSDSNQKLQLTVKVETDEGSGHSFNIFIDFKVKKGS